MLADESARLKQNKKQQVVKVLDPAAYGIPYISIVWAVLPAVLWRGGRFMRILHLAALMVTLMLM
jgi:hypothetical protein